MSYQSTVCCKNSSNENGYNKVCGNTSLYVKKNGNYVSYICSDCNVSVGKQLFDRYLSYNQKCKICNSNIFKLCVINTDDGKEYNLYCKHCLETKGKDIAKQEIIYVDDDNKEISKKEYDQYIVSEPCNIDGCRARRYIFTKNERDNDIYICSSGHEHEFSGSVECVGNCYGSHPISMNQFYLETTTDSYGNSILSFRCTNEECYKEIYRVSLF